MSLRFRAPVFAVAAGRVGGTTIPSGTTTSGTEAGVKGMTTGGRHEGHVPDHVDRTTGHAL